VREVRRVKKEVHSFRRGRVVETHRHSLGGSALSACGDGARGPARCEKGFGGVICTSYSVSSGMRVTSMRKWFATSFMGRPAWPKFGRGGRGMKGAATAPPTAPNIDDMSSIRDGCWEGR
jgi:hypothetical protein